MIMKIINHFNFWYFIENNIFLRKYVADILLSKFRIRKLLWYQSQTPIRKYAELSDV